MATQPGSDGGSAPPNTALPAPSANLPPSYDVAEETKHPQGPGVQPQPPQPPMTQSPFVQPGYPQGQPGQPAYPQAAPVYVQGQPPVQYVQGQPPIQYVVSTPYPMIANPPKPAYPGPHYFIIYVIVATVICGFLNPLSLVLSMAALVCVAMASHNKSIGQYPKASKMSTAAFVLTNLTVVFTLLLWVSLIGVIVGYNDGANTCRYVYYTTTPGYDSSPGYHVHCTSY